MSKSARPIIQSLVLAGIFSAVGFGFGAIFFGDLQEDRDETAVSQNDGRSAELQRLKSALAKAQAKIKILEEGQALASESRTKTTLLPAPRLPDSATQEAKELFTKLNTRIASLQEELDKERKKDAPLSDEEMAEKVQELKDKFDDALAKKSGADALKAMKELSKLDSRAYGTLVGLWDKMEKAKWLGLGWRERRGWASADLFHWALNPKGMSLGNEKLEQDFRVQAVWLLGWYEDDATKKADTYTSFLSTLTLPSELTEEEKRKRSRRRGWDADKDLYRASLRGLSRIPSSEASRLLTGLVSNAGAPNDIRLTAVRGLSKQLDDASLQALKYAVNDPDPQIRRSAELGLVRRDPPVRGWLITDITKNSQAATLGIESGSIIVGADGKNMTSSRDLFQKIYRSKEDVHVSVYKNGAVQIYKFKGGQRLGVDGEDITPKKQ
jgi:hypothetical protein